MMTDEGPVGAMRSSSVAGRNRPLWLLTADDLRSIDGPTAAAAAHQKPAARFPMEDLVSPSSGHGGRRGTGAFLPCVQMQNLPLSQPVPRPSGKPAKPKNNSTTGNGNGPSNSNKKKPHPSPPTTPKCGGGPGMHAMFIDSSSRPSGTGVFLPRSTAAELLLLHDHAHTQRQPTRQKKPRECFPHVHTGYRNMRIRIFVNSIRRPHAAVRSSPVLLPTRVVHLLRQRIAKQESATAAGTGLLLGPPHHLSSALFKGDKIHEDHIQQQNRAEGGKRGSDTPAAAAVYDDVARDYHDHSSNPTTTTKCAVPLQDYSSSTLIEKLLPEEWSY